MQADALDACFALGDALRFVTGADGFTQAVIRNTHATARVSLYAGQLLSWQPRHTRHDVLFLSGQAYFQHGKAIKGGIPLCWPWFGPDPEGRGRPAHGFARISPWQVQETALTDNGATRLVLGLALNERTRALWDGDIAARLSITVGETLQLELQSFNHAERAVTLTQALHSYFAVGDIARSQVLGLDGCTYIDKTDQGRNRVQSGAVTIAGEVDRIYTGVHGALEIHDDAWRRVIRIRSGGSASAVVWNPGQAVAAGMPDLGDEDYRRMLCVETANAGADAVEVAAGGRYVLTAELAVTDAGA